MTFITLYYIPFSKGNKKNSFYQLFYKVIRKTSLTGGLIKISYLIPPGGMGTIFSTFKKDFYFEYHQEQGEKMSLY